MQTKSVSLVQHSRSSTLTKSLSLQPVHFSVNPFTAKMKGALLLRLGASTALNLLSPALYSQAVRGSSISYDVLEASDIQLATFKPEPVPELLNVEKRQHTQSSSDSRPSPSHPYTNNESTVNQPNRLQRSTSISSRTSGILPTRQKSPTYISISRQAVYTAITKLITPTTTSSRSQSSNLFNKI